MREFLPDKDMDGERELDEKLAAVSEGLNEYGYDKWGFSPEYARPVLKLARWLYRHYFRIQVHDIDRIPAGRGLLIGNHSSQLAYDGMMVATAMLLDGQPPRAVKAMIEKFFQYHPFVNVFMARSGQLTGLPQTCQRLLEDDELLLVFPEGVLGSGKLYWDRYTLQRFGTGFMRLALQARAPIIPFGFIGGEEMCPSIYNLKPLAKLIRTPYVPVTPLLLPLPLPAKCSIYFGEPLYFEGSGNEEDRDILDKIDVVKQRVGELVERGLSERKGVFF